MVVGPTGNTKTWYLPKKLLVNASPFFAAALNGSFAEATTKVVDFPEDNTDAFALFIRCLFVGEISGDLFDSEGTRSGDEILGTYDASTYGLLYATNTLVYLQAYILGDKLGCSVFLDHVMLELIRWYETTGERILFIYEQSGLGSKLRRFAIDLFRYDLQNGHLPKDTATFVSASKIAEDFALDFLKACVEEDCGEAIWPGSEKGRYMEVLTTVDEDWYEMVGLHFLAEVHQLSQSVKNDVLTSQLESNRAFSCVAP